MLPTTKRFNAKKKLFTIALLTTFVTIGVSGSVFLNRSSLGAIDQPIANNWQVSQSLASGSGEMSENNTAFNQTDKDLMFTINPKPSWQNQLFADQITNTQLKEILVPTTAFGANFHVKLLPVSEEMLINGYVQFVVVQIKRTYMNGVPTADSKAEFLNPTKSVVKMMPNGEGNWDLSIVEPTPQPPEAETPPVVEQEQEEHQTEPETMPQPNGGATDNQSTSASNTSNEQSNESNAMLAAASVSVTSEAQASKMVEVDGQMVPETKIWTTQKINNLILPKKFNFKFNSDAEIGAFLANTNRNVNTLTSEDVLNNLVSKKDASDILPSTTRAVISHNNIDDVSEQDAQRYGVAKVVINFHNDTTNGMENNANNFQNQWVNNMVPTGAAVTKILRGLAPVGGGSKAVVHLQSSNFLNTMLDLQKIQRVNPNFQKPFNFATANQAPISAFTPTELVNALGGNDSLTKLLGDRNYLADDNQNALPAIFINYMDKNFWNIGVNSSGNGMDHNSPFKGTGLKNITQFAIQQTDGTTVNNSSANSVADMLTITNIQAHANDATGTLQLKVAYNRYDVFRNVLDLNATQIISINGLQTNQDANQNLFFQWKTDAELTFNNQQAFLSEFELHQNNPAYLRDLTNNLFNGSTALYQKERTVEISRENNNGIKVTLTFPSLNNLYYQTSSGSTPVFGQQFTNTFFFNTQTPPVTVTFADQATVTNAISDYATLTPSQLINRLVSNEANSINNQLFFTTSVNNQYDFNVLYFSNFTNDGIGVQVTAVNKTDPNMQFSFLRYYHGLQAEQSADFVYNFSFASNANGGADDFLALKMIPIQMVTAQDVIDHYLSKLNLFTMYNSQFTLSPDDVTITPDPNNGTILVTVVVPAFLGTENSGDNGQTPVNRFATVLRGFNSQVLVRDDSDEIPLDLTIILSVLFASVITVSLVAAIIYVLIKQNKLKNKRV